jgi:hypothetical protein
MQRFRSFAGRDKGHELAPFGFQLNILACKPLIKQIISMIPIDSIDQAAAPLWTLDRPMPPRLGANRDCNRSGYGALR